MTEKVREIRLRRIARHQGLRVVKSRRRDERALDFGTYGIVDPYLNVWIAFGGSGGFGMHLDEVESWLREDGE